MCNGKSEAMPGEPLIEHKLDTGWQGRLGDNYTEFNTLKLPLRPKNGSKSIFKAANLPDHEDSKLSGKLACLSNSMVFFIVW